MDPVTVASTERQRERERQRGRGSEREKERAKRAINFPTCHDQLNINF
jgi:hypothetical protein